jgi:hypothetical protein
MNGAKKMLKYDKEDKSLMFTYYPVSRLLIRSGDQPEKKYFEKNKRCDIIYFVTV